MRESFSFTLLRSTVCTSRFWFPLKDSIPKSFEIYAQGQGPLKDDQVRFFLKSTMKSEGKN
jgi:hypothetical protein